MKKKVVFIFMFLALFMLMLPLNNVTVKATDEINHNITIQYARNVNEIGELVLDENIGKVEVSEEISVYGNTNSLHVTNKNEDFVFSFFMEKGYVVSSSPNYIFRVVEEHEFLAFFRPADKKQVVIVDANNKHLGSILVDDEFILEEVALDPFKAKLNNPPGYEIVGWYDNPSFTGTKITTLRYGETIPTKLYAKWEEIK